MRKSVLFILLLCAATFFGQAQEMREPAKLMEIMEKSTKTYGIEMLSKKITAPDRSENLVYPGYYRKTATDGSFTVEEYKPTALSKAYFDKAEEFFGADKMDSALVYYQKSYDADNTYLQPLIYIGQISGIQKRDKDAIAAYEKVLAQNPIDYMSHWFLADILIRNNDKKGALKEILTAHILNRNNKRLLVSLKLILEENNLSWNDWVFNPQYTLSGEGKNIKLAYKTPWLAYAIAKAVQQYEDAGAEGQSMDLNKDLIGKEKECLFGLFVGVETEKLSDDEEYTIPLKALKKKMLNEFILYEVILPEYPVLGRQLPDGLVQDIVTYLIKIKFAQ